MSRVVTLAIVIYLPKFRSWMTEEEIPLLSLSANAPSLSWTTEKS